MEKVISEWRIVETDDGFRIEVKGDKKAMHEWFELLKRCGPLRRRRHMAFGPWGAGFWGHGFWGCGPEEEGEFEEEKH